MIELSDNRVWQEQVIVGAVRVDLGAANVPNTNIKLIGEWLQTREIHHTNDASLACSWLRLLAEGGLLYRNFFMGIGSASRLSH
jgi:hypothetical protein